MERFRRRAQFFHSQRFLMIITTVWKTFNHRDIVVQKLGLNQKIYLCVCRTSIAQCYSDWLLKGSLPMRSQLFCERRSFDKVWVLNFSCISCQKQTIVKWTHPTPCWHLWIVRVENENKPSKGTYFLQMSPTSPFHTSHIEPSPNSPVMWFHFSFELTMPVSNWSKPGVVFFPPECRRSRLQPPDSRAAGCDWRRRLDSLSSTNFGIGAAALSSYLYWQLSWNSLACRVPAGFGWLPSYPCN